MGVRPDDSGFGGGLVRLRECTRGAWSGMGWDRMEFLGYGAWRGVIYLVVIVLIRSEIIQHSLFIWLCA